MGAALLILLAVASDIKFRRRSSQEALAGAVDWQVMLELGVWAGVALWLVGAGLVAGFTAWRLLPQRQGPVLQVYMLIAALALGSSILDGDRLSLVRATQLLTLVLVAALVAQHLRRSPEALQQFWCLSRRVVVGVTLVCILVSLAPGAQVRGGTDRYNWFALHPITTGIVIGVAVLALAAMFLSLPDRRFVRTRILGWGALFLMLVLLLLMTRSRGPIFGTLFGLVVLVVLSPHRMRRRQVLFALGSTTPLFVAGIGVRELSDVIIRGQTQDQLLSLTGRTDLFAYAWELALDRPLFGHGYLAGRSVFLEEFHWAGESHNALIEALVSLGFVGVGLYLVLFGLLLRALVRVLRHGAPEARLIAGEALALVVFIVSVGVIADGFAGAPSFSVYALVLAAVAADVLTAHLGPRQRWWVPAV